MYILLARICMWRNWNLKSGFTQLHYNVALSIHKEWKLHLTDQGRVMTPPPSHMDYENAIS